jgi:hypothetical protein
MLAVFIVNASGCSLPPVPSPTEPTKTPVETLEEDKSNDFAEEAQNDLPEEESPRYDNWPYPKIPEKQADLDLSSVDSYDLTGLIDHISEVLLTENGFLAACSLSEPFKAILYDLNTRQLVASVDWTAEGVGIGDYDFEGQHYYCIRIDETAGGVNFTFEDGYCIATAKTLFIDWQGNYCWKYPGTFRLPFGGGAVAEWEGDIVYIDGKSGEKRILATFDLEIEFYDPKYARLKLFNVLDENSFIYCAKYDSETLATYIYDIRTGQSTRTKDHYTGYPLGVGGNYLLCAFYGHGTDGMRVIDIATLKTISEITYNNAGHSQAAISGDGALVMAIHNKDFGKNGFLFFDAQTGLLLKDYLLDFSGDSLNHDYGFWQQRPYFFSSGEGKVTLYILPEHMTTFERQLP